MSAQHKRRGRIARLERVRRAQERMQPRGAVITGTYWLGRQGCDFRLGKLVAWAEWQEVGA